MDMDRFDRIAKMLSVTDSRRGLLRFGAALPLAGLLATHLGTESEARRRRRKRKRKDRQGTVLVCQNGETISVPRSAVPGIRLAGGAEGACAGRVGTGSGGAGGGLGSGAACLPATADLQSAIDAAGSGETIRLCAGTWALTSWFGFGLLISKNLTLMGAGADQSIVDGTRSVRVLQISGGAAVTVQDLTITKGTATSGGGIYNFGTLNLVGAKVTDNTATDGAGIYNVGGTVTLGAGSSVTGNSAGGNGGGINVVSGAVSLQTGSSVSGNTAQVSGGGIYNGAGAVTLRSGSLVTDNIADSGSFSEVSGGGGIYNYTGGTLTLEPGSHVSGNTAQTSSQVPPGGGVLNIRPGKLTIANTTIVTGNTPDDVCDFDPGTATCV
jgi:hypothetical protein